MTHGCRLGVVWVKVCRLTPEHGFGGAEERQASQGGHTEHNHDARKVADRDYGSSLGTFVDSSYGGGPHCKATAVGSCSSPRYEPRRTRLTRQRFPGLENVDQLALVPGRYNVTDARLSREATLPRNRHGAQYSLLKTSTAIDFAQLVPSEFRKQVALQCR